MREPPRRGRGINQRLGVRDDFGADARAADIAAVGNEIQRLREKYLPLAQVQRATRRPSTRSIRPPNSAS